MEIEVETKLVFSKSFLKLRFVSGDLLTSELKVFESEEPYVLVFTISTERNEDIRLDVFKEDLARELRAWLEGKYIRYPAALVPVRIDDAIMKFIKFAKTPKQEDLIMWILSRCELYCRDKNEGDEEDPMTLVFGGRSMEESDKSIQALTRAHNDINNPFSKTATIAAAMNSHEEYNKSVRFQENRGRSSSPTSHSRSMSAGATTERSLGIRRKYGDDLGMFEMTKSLIGKSQTLESLKASRVKGRDGAKQVLSTKNFTDDHWRMCNEIERARKDIELRMDERRRMIEVAKIRQLQSAEKFRTIKDNLHQAHGGNKFFQQAMHELLTLRKIEEDIEDDIRKQKNRVHRGAQKVAWTMAPSGFSNRRGKSQRGPVLGPGPLPPNATTHLKDPRLDTTMRKFYWDSAGRRHVKDHSMSDETSLVDKAMEAIRRAAANIASFKLDLKAVFEQFDSSGDGFLSPEEMAAGFLAMGVKLDLPTMTSIFKHFDPNDSGSVHYGEFVWAFFNRRGLVRQWKRKTEGMTMDQIKSRFHAADKNGNGTLSPKEFKKVLKSFGMELPDESLNILLDRFDMDGDGEIDMGEFLSFIESEQKSFGGTDNTVKPVLDIPNPITEKKVVRRSHERASTGVINSRKSTPKNEETSRSSSPNDVKRRPNASRGGNNITAPAELQIKPLAKTASMTSREATPRGGNVVKIEHASENNLAETTDVLWMSRMLQAQAEVEARLGRKYFKNT